MNKIKLPLTNGNTGKIKRIRVDANDYAITSTGNPASAEFVATLAVRLNRVIEMLNAHTDILKKDEQNRKA